MTRSEGFSERVCTDIENGEIRDGDIRYMMIRPDGLMGLFQRLSPDARAEALRAFADSICEHGGKSAKRYRNDGYGLGDTEAGKLLDTIANTAPQLGWGRWQFERPDAASLRLYVANSPFAAAMGPDPADRAVCAPISGMLRAVAEMLLGAPVTVTEEFCAASAGCAPDASGGTKACHFIARHAPAAQTSICGVCSHP